MQRAARGVVFDGSSSALAQAVVGAALLPIHPRAAERAAALKPSKSLPTSGLRSSARSIGAVCFSSSAASSLTDVTVWNGGGPRCASTLPPLILMISIVKTSTELAGISEPIARPP